MKKRSLLAGLLLGLMVCAAGCGKSPAGSTASPSGTDGTQTTAQTTIQESREETMITLEDLMVTKDWIGKTQDEIGLSPDEKERFFDLSGSFLGKKATGMLTFTNGKDGSASTVKQVSFYVKNGDLFEIYDQLLELFGGPSNQGMEPYVESNGGAVEWYIFDAGETLIRISQGSKNDYVAVEMTVNPEPGDTRELVLRKRAESGIATLPLIMMMKVTGYENGILTVEITNQMGADSTYTDEYILAKSSDNGETYAHLHRMGYQNSPEPEPNVYEIADLETQELKCDLRVFGKVEAGKYMLLIDDMRAEFELIPADEDTGEIAQAAWFCPECGKKNRDTDKCEFCGAKKGEE